MLEFIVGTMIFVIIVTVCLGVFSRKIAAKSKGGEYLRRALKGNMALMASLVLVAAIFLFSGAAIHSSAADTEPVSETEQTQSDSSSAEGMAYLAAALLPVLLRLARALPLLSRARRRSERSAMIPSCSEKRLFSSVLRKELQYTD